MKPLGDSIKALEGNRVGGYLVRFTDADNPDLHGEYFTKGTNFWLKEHPVIGKPVLIDHAFDEHFKSVPVGIIDFLKEDEIGLWIEAKLKTRAEYEDMLRGWKDRKFLDDATLPDSAIPQLAENLEKAVKAFFATQKAQWSSGALPQSVETAQDGHIRSWAIIEGTGVYTPAEPDGTQISLKGLIDSLTSNPASPAIEATPKEHDNAMDATQSNVSKALTQGHKDMDFLQKLLAMIQEYMAAQGGDESMMSAVEEELKAEMPEEELAKALESEDETATEKAVAKAIAIADKHINAHKAKLNRVDNAFEKAFARKAREAAPVDRFGAGGNSQYDPTRKGQPRVSEMQDRAYMGWEAEDFSFAASLAKMTGKTAKAAPLAIDQKFYRAFAEKAEKSVNANKLFLNHEAYKGIQAIKADELDYSTQAGFGDEWVPTVWADAIWERPRLDNVVQNLFSSIEMPSNPYEYPVESTDPTVYLVGETKNENVLALDITTSPIPDSKIGTAKVTFTASKFGLRVMYSAELEEDGIRRLVPQFRKQAERAMQDRIDYVAINGDTATTLNINADGETITDTTRAYLAYNGLIKQPLVTATTNRLDASGATPSLTLLRSTRALLGNAEGYNPENLAWIMDYPTYMKLLNDDAIITVDKYGAAATVVTGELGRIDGIRVFVSAQMALADSDGKITQAGNSVNRGRAILVHYPTWLFGYRRRIAQSLDYLAYYDTWILTLTMRNHFVPRTASNGTLQSTDDSTAILYNIGV